MTPGPPVPPNPYVGPKPFERQQLFGRDQEIAELRYLLTSERTRATVRAFGRRERVRWSRRV